MARDPLLWLCATVRTLQRRVFELESQLRMVDAKLVVTEVADENPLFQPIEVFDGYGPVDTVNKSDAANCDVADDDYYADLADQKFIESHGIEAYHAWCDNDVCSSISTIVTTTPPTSCASSSTHAPTLSSELAGKVHLPVIVEEPKDDVMDVNVLKKLITEIYGEFRPEKVDDVEWLFRRYAGNELALYDSVRSKYCPHPPIAPPSVAEPSDAAVLAIVDCFHEAVLDGKEEQFQRSLEPELRWKYRG